MATSIIQKEQTYRDYSVTTENNTVVKPFGAYKWVSIALNGYKATSGQIIGGSGDASSVTIGTDGNGAYVYTYTARTVTLRVSYVRA